MKHLVLAALLAVLAGRAAASESEVIGMRFVVSASLGRTAAEHLATRARLERHVAELNSIFAASEVRLRAEIVRVDFEAFEELEVMRILDDMAHQRGAFAELFALADEFGADYTFAIVRGLRIRGTPGCGRAFAVNRTAAEVSSTRRAFAAVDIACGARTLGHELGHLMGLNHGHLVDRCEPGRGHTTAIAPYANGYAEGNCDGQPQHGEFGTLMVGGWMKSINGDGQSSLPLFSNPLVRDPRCGRRGICGDERVGDEARALNENAHRYAGHEEPDVHTLAYGSAPLAACIRERYHRVEIRDLVELRCPGRAIESLDGIQRLVALRRVDLSGNRVSDPRPLLALDPARVERIDLAGNPIPDCQNALKRFDNKVICR